MSKRKKNATSLPERPRSPERMQRHTQRAVKFADRRKKNSRNACRLNKGRGGHLE